MASLRVVLVAGHPILRQGIRCLLEQSGEVEVVGEAARAQQASLLTESLLPDAIIIGPSLLDGSSMELVRTVRRSHPHVRVVVLGTGEESRQGARARAYGAHAYLGRQARASALLEALRAAGGRRPTSGEAPTAEAAAVGPKPAAGAVRTAGDRTATASVAATNAEATAASTEPGASAAGRGQPARSWPPGITPAEQRVLEALGRGLSNREIAGLLGLRVTTVKAHLRPLYQKLRVKNRTQAVLAIRQHLLQSTGRD